MVAIVAETSLRYRYRLRFRKDGDLRLVSHHDLMHVLERMLRRAELPIAHTQGFHPQPRMVFALSLALGIAGGNEVLELELTESLEPEHLWGRLARQAPTGLTIRGVRRLEAKSSPLVRRAFYRLPLHLDEDVRAIEARGGLLGPPAGLTERCHALLAQGHLWVERSRPRPRRLDIRPYLCEARLHEGCLELAIWVTPTGTARPEEYALLLGLTCWLDAGAFFERSDLEMTDECAEPLPDFAVPEPQGAVEAARAERLPAPETAAPPTALMAGPLSFDT
jgi:radical SAM-linked protein